MRLISKTRERQQELSCVPREDQIHSLPQEKKKRENFLNAIPVPMNSMT